MAPKTQAATKVVTGRVRLSYAFIWETRTDENGENPKYSCALMIPKDTADGKATYERLIAAENVAKQAGKDSKWGGKIPSNLSSIIHDGDEDADLDKNPEYAGHWYMNVSSRTKPGIVDQNVNDILDSTEVYSGCFARVSVNAFPYNTAGKKGVSFGLNHIQKVADGESLGGRSRAEDDFDAVEVDDEDLL